MTRTTRGFVAKRRRKKVLKLASGFQGANNRLFRTAQQRTLRALSLAYRDRRLYKRKIRSLWIRRLNSFLTSIKSESAGPSLRKFPSSVKADLEHLVAPQESVMPSYSLFISKLKKSSILLNRKILSQLAIFDSLSLKKIIYITSSGSPRD